MIKRPKHLNDLGVGSVVVVANEFGGAMVIDQGLVDSNPLWVSGVALASALGAFSLLAHLLLEACGVDVNATFCRYFLGQLQWKPVSVMQLERSRTRDGFFLGANFVLKDGETIAQCRAKLLFFASDDPKDEIAVGCQLGIRPFHDAERGLD